MAGGSIPSSFARSSPHSPRGGTQLCALLVSPFVKWGAGHPSLTTSTFTPFSIRFPFQPFVRSSCTHPNRCHRRIHFLSSVLDDTCCQPLTPSCKRRGQIFTSVLLYSDWGPAILESTITRARTESDRPAHICSYLLTCFTSTLSLHSQTMLNVLTFIS